MVLFWICDLAVCEGVSGCHALKSSELKMLQAWNPNSEGEEELGKMEMNSTLMAIICRNTTWEAFHDLASSCKECGMDIESFWKIFFSGLLWKASIIYSECKLCEDVSLRRSTLTL